jgi:hypothetical protein
LEEKYIMTKNEGMAAELLSDAFSQDADSLALALAKKLWPEEMASDETPPRRRQNLLLAASGVYAKMRGKGLCSGSSKEGYRLTEKGMKSEVAKNKRRPEDRTVVQRNIRLETKLRESGGVRMSLRLEADNIKKLDALVKSGKAETRTGVIRVLIEEAEV